MSDETGEGAMSEHETSIEAGSRPRPALPSSVSEQARQSLANWRVMPPYPRLDNPDAWIDMITTQEMEVIEILRSLRSRQSARVVIDDIDVDSVPTYVIRAEDVDPGPDTSLDEIVRPPVTKFGAREKRAEGHSLGGTRGYDSRTRLPRPPTMVVVMFKREDSVNWLRVLLGGACQGPQGTSPLLCWPSGEARK